MGNHCSEALLIDRSICYISIFAFVHREVGCVWTFSYEAPDIEDVMEASQDVLTLSYTRQVVVSLIQWKDMNSFPNFKVKHCMATIFKEKSFEKISLCHFLNDAFR